MRPFSYERAASVVDAVKAASTDSDSHIGSPVQFLAGGTNLLDLMKIDVMFPDHVVDINPLQDSLSHISLDDSGLRLGALSRMSEIAAHPDIIREYPLISDSLKLAASAQLRNMASIGGNVLQRTRCSYFRDVTWSACNKRQSGSGCAALEGNNRKHAVLGASPHCIATYPGDFAAALIAMEADILIAGPSGTRTIPFQQLHRLPGDTPHIETNLAPGEMITEFFIPALPYAKRSLYLKVRDRESYEFAIASAAIVLDLDEDKVRDVRIALGGVATIPWRAHAAEDVLKGKELTERNAEIAASVAFEPARAHGENAYKIELGQNTIVRALLDAAALEV